MTKQMESRATKDDGLDLRDLFGLLLDRKWWIAGTAAVFGLAGVGYALTAAPVYQAEAMLQVESKVPSIPGISDLTSLGGTAGSAATTEIALIQSRAVIGAAVDELKLDVVVSPRRMPVLGGYFARKFQQKSPAVVSPARFGMSSYGWGGEAAKIDQLDLPPALIGAKLTLKALGDGKFELSDADDSVLAKGRVGELVKAGQVAISVSELSSNEGACFDVVKLSRLDVITTLQNAIATTEAGKDSGILQITYQSEYPLLAQNVVQHVSAAYVRQNVDRSSAEAASQLQFVREQLPTVRREVEKAQTAMTSYQSQANSVDITMQTKGLLEQEVAVETAIQQLRLRQVEMDRTFTREHPAYRALLTQIQSLEGRKAGFQKQVSNLPDTQQELLRLSRDLQVSNELYTALLNQAQQLDVARAGAVGNVRIVDQAIVDVANPVSPRKALIVAISGLLGLVLSVAFVFLQRMLNPGIEDPADIEALGLPVYAAIPLSVSNTLPKLRKGKHGTRVVADGRQHLLAVSAPADPTVEALRSLRTSLHFAMLEAKNNILTISGPRPGVGKTFVSTNLAAVIAQAGQRVLVIDADMRKGTLHKILGVSQQKGLSDVLGGKLSADDVIHPVAGLDNMHYMVRGDIPPNPAELLMHPRFAQLLQDMSGKYDLVIVDTPPILAVTDPALVATHAGSSLLVTRFGVNQAKEIELTLQRFEQNGVQIKGAIFNAVEKRATGYYSYGYYEYKSDEKA